jgi:hypothetical protein
MYVAAIVSEYGRCKCLARCVGPCTNLLSVVPVSLAKFITVRSAELSDGQRSPVHMSEAVDETYPTCGPVCGDSSGDLRRRSALDSLGRDPAHRALHKIFVPAPRFAQGKDRVTVLFLVTTNKRIKFSKYRSSIFYSISELLCRSRWTCCWLLRSLCLSSRGHM